MNVLALDPGLTKPGVALLQKGLLVRAERLHIPKEWSKLEILDRCDHVAQAAYEWFTRFKYPTREPITIVVEWPQWYGDNEKGIDPNDLAGLCGICGALVGRMRERVCREIVVRSPKPREVWGTIGKSTKGDPWVSGRGFRLITRLTPAERAAVESKHDALDAAGLALWAAGRWAPRHNYPGAV